MDEAGKHVTSARPKWFETGFRPYLLICLVALALSAPAILTSRMIHDSFWIDQVWADQFTELLRGGTLYPRWLPQSYDGLGAPVFYFYPPLAFYVTGAAGLTGLSAYHSVIAAFVALLAVSGVTMFRWLRGWTAHALPASILYMALPYHLVDFYRRGALAEFMAFALLPLIACGLRRAQAERAPVGLAAAYGVLILTHLPSALLVGALFIAPHVAWTTIRQRRIPWPSISGIVLGIGLAGIYLVPMLALKQHVAIEHMFSDAQYRAANWSLLTPSRWPTRDGAHFLTLLCGTTAFAGFVLLAGRCDSWVRGSVAICAIAAGLIPGFWSLPLVANVQFPWRALILAEFMLLTGLARTPLRPIVVAIGLLPMLALSSVFLQPVHPEDSSQPKDWFERHLDVREYVPRGAAEDHGWYADAAMKLSQRHREAIVTQGRVVAPHFYFPSWQVFCQGRRVAIAPDPGTRLLSWTGTNTNCSAKIGITIFEFAGAGLSLLSLAILIGFARRRQSEIAPPPPS